MKLVEIHPSNFWAANIGMCVVGGGCCLAMVETCERFPLRYRSKVVGYSLIFMSTVGGMMLGMDLGNSRHGHLLEKAAIGVAATSMVGYPLYKFYQNYIRP